MRYVGNAFSLGMLDGSQRLEVSALNIHQARYYVRSGSWESCVGHADTAALLEEMLGVPVEMRRVSTALHSGDELLVAQYNGPRLPEGATSLPAGAKIRWYHVAVLDWYVVYDPM